jgi:hypothetical protein
MYTEDKGEGLYNALERVAVMSDEIADWVRDNCGRWKDAPNLLGAHSSRS